MSYCIHSRSSVELTVISKLLWESSKFLDHSLHETSVENQTLQRSSIKEPIVKKTNTTKTNIFCSGIAQFPLEGLEGQHTKTQGFNTCTHVRTHATTHARMDTHTHTHTVY